MCRLIDFQTAADLIFYFLSSQGNENGMTLISNNPFINKKELGPFEKGIRIDYILFKVGGRASRSLRFNPFIPIPWGSGCSADLDSPPYLSFSGFVQSRHPLRLHVHHQRLRGEPAVSVFRPRGADVRAEAHGASSQ